ncbi:hypothetical protein UFOVP276_143 [uncultured Caudovirales phage]|uniref:Uncharacterized protein n=1 Tax=uncultured Caudovirales phage TaxID=2100421 RepID=A0A6J5LBX0_9CAUD|nr:hypothetical protein UFOVP127_37 [uncultured Caudovirales phage]CAB4135187.1 hypothetical protein UFOVP276_143 [uncultured Caudovirales phage]
MAIGHKLGLRLFMEGIEVPVISAQIQCIADATAAASIQIIATDKALEFMPRTMVHLFFYDFVGAEMAGVAATTDQVEFDYKQYKLLFMGEVQGISFAKSSGSRSIMLSCVDFSCYWDTTYQYNFQGQLLGGRREAAFIGANANLFTGVLGHGVGFISRLLSGKPVSFPNLEGLLGGIIHVLEAIGGAYYGADTFKGANDFTALAELRIKLLQQVWAAEKDTSTKDLFNRKTFNMWMNREIGGLDKLVTFRGLVQLMQRFIYHEVYPNPAAYFAPGEEGLKRKGTVSTDISKDPRTAAFWADMQRLEKSWQVASTGIELATRALDVPKETTYALQEMRKILTKATVPTVPGLDLVKSVSLMKASLRTINTALFKADSFEYDPQKAGVANAESARNAMGEIHSVWWAMFNSKIKNSVIITYNKLDRVNNQLYRPDIWFGAAPRCNVLFPEMYESFQWTRNYLREITRLELQLTHEILGDDALFNQRNYAPDVADARKGMKLSSRKFNNMIMYHELMTGIIPMYEKMTQANLFAMKSKAVSASGGEKVSYAQRAVNHQYFKHRFAARQMSASGRFNPWFVPGFPAVIIDRPMSMNDLTDASLPIDQLLYRLKERPGFIDVTGDPATGTPPSRAKVLRNLVGPQYTGVCVQLAHSLSQEGGTTSYSFSEARVHRESTEFLGVDKIYSSVKTGKFGTRNTTVACLPDKVPKIKGKGPCHGVITKVSGDKTAQFKGQEFDIYPGPGRATVGLLSVPNDPEGPIGLVGPSNYQARTITESIEVREKVATTRPMEDAIAPPWIWDGWKNLRIGETYKEMIGTQAITDIEGVISTELVGSALTADKELQALYDTKLGYQTGSGAYLDKDNTGDYQSRPGVPEQDKVVTNKRRRKGKQPPPTVSQEAASGELSASMMLAIDTNRTIEASIDFLVRVYSMVRTGGFDIGEFIRHYTWRPIATIDQILGTRDLIIEEVYKNNGKNGVIQGTEGFHSRAFGNVAGLENLVNASVHKVLGLSVEKQHATLSRLDTRSRKWAAVMAYADELTGEKGSRGLLG